MYSYEERKKAVQLYIQYDKSPTSVIRELGYPKEPRTLKIWYRDAIANKGKPGEKKYVGKYSPEQRETAVKYYLEHGKCYGRTVRKLGYPSVTMLKVWVSEDAPEVVQPCKERSTSVNCSQSEKAEAVVALLTHAGSAREIADEYGVRSPTLYKWKSQFLHGEGAGIMSKKNDLRNSSPGNVAELIEELEMLQKKADELNQEVHRLRLERDVLEIAAEIIKKDQGVSLMKLTNREKAILIDALRNKYSLKELLDVVHMAKSSYCYQEKVLHSPDKYADLRIEIKKVFEESKKTYGYRRVHCVLKGCGITVSEKVVRNIMKADGLVVCKKKRSKFNSYKGEITPAVDNLLNRDFHADLPNEKWITDITEFSIPAGKVYLSPIIDCFDGLPVSWTIGTIPNADLTNEMLEDAISTLKPNEHPIVHSDRGSHYRWPGWIERMDSAGLIRSMSKKGCSPDNSACEGFFGRLKNEMFYNSDWRKVEVEDFISILNEYIHWYAEKRIKISLGGMSPIQYRRSLGLID